MDPYLIKPMKDDYTDYLRDESRAVGHADSISFPKNESEVAELIKSLYAQGIPITVQGARTGLAAGAVPHGGHILNLSRMDQVKAFRTAADGHFHITLEAGVILSQLRKQIDQKKFDTTNWTTASLEAYDAFCSAPPQFFSPDPTESSATLGGMVACNASGARSYLYGPTRDHISGLRVVLRDGQIVALKRGEYKAAGRTLRFPTLQKNWIEVDLPTYVMPQTKNASGYFIEDAMDAIDLFIGSDGTLGVVTEVEIRLQPMPETIWGVTCFFTSEENALEFVTTARDTMKQLASMEYFDGHALDILRDQKRNNAGFSKLQALPDHVNTAIYVELHCQNEARALEGLKAIGQLLKQAGTDPRDTWVARNDSDRDRLLFFRHAVPESVNMLIDHRKKTNPIITKLGTDMSVPDAHLKDIMAMYHRMLKDAQLESAIWGHVGDNHLHVNILPRNEEDYLKGKALYDLWAAEVTRMGGAVSAEHGVGKLKAKYLEVMYGKEAIEEMAKLKFCFDPKGLLGAGNLFEPLKGEMFP